MATIKHFEELEIWQQARALNKQLLPIFERLASKSDYRTLGRIKAAAGSVMDNIAEDFERDSRKEFINHLSYAKGSCGEVQSQIYRFYDENIISDAEQSSLLQAYKSLAKDIGNFIRYLNTSEIKGQKFQGRSN